MPWIIIPPCEKHFSWAFHVFIWLMVKFTVIWSGENKDRCYTILFPIGLNLGLENFYINISFTL